ncbi:hypothetical protein AAC387_Pa05g2609 [Persea americana]
MEDLPLNLKESSMKTEEDDEFYEQIEAPKFVDFTDPDRSRPDDGSWFCIRIGCDQKHEQIDPDALYKSFVLRVMAARSPNLRLQKALHRQAPSVLDKCPRSAPAKSAKSRIPRLSVLASIPQKIGENKLKVSLFSKFKSIPCEGKVVQSSVTAKALTTPRKKKCPPHEEVQNLKVKTATPKNRLVAQALAIQTPKKSEKTSFNCHKSPTLGNCSEMKKLEVSGHTKKAPRYCKSSGCAACESKRKPSTSSGPGKPKLRTCKLHKNRIEVPSKYLKKISKPSVQICHNPVPQEDDDSSDMEIDGKSRNDSLEACPTSNGHEQSLNYASSMNSEVTNLLPSSEESSTRENSLPNSVEFKENNLFKAPNIVVGGETKAMENTDKENSTDSTSVGFTTMTEEFLPSSDEYSTSDNSLSKSEKVLLDKDLMFQTSSAACDETSHLESADKENNMEAADKENINEETTVAVFDVKAESVASPETSNGVVDVMEPIEIADKENASASNGNRDMNLNIHRSARKTWQHREHENPQKVTEVPVRILKENSAADSAQGGRLKKSKPTNPKPFRLRTDERGILKEAKLERRMQLDHLKEATPASNEMLLKRQPARNDMQERGILKEAKLERRMQLDPLKEATPATNEMLLKRQPGRNDKQTNGNSHGWERSQYESNRTARKAQIQQNRPTDLKFSRYVEPIKEIRTPQRQKPEDGKEKVSLKVQSTSRSPSVQRTSRSPSLHEQLVRPQRGLALKGQLAVIKETSTISRTNVSPCETQVERRTISTTSTSRSSSRGKRPSTVPKEPNFHSIHVPKSCTKTPANVIS